MSGWERLGWTSEGYTPTWVYFAASVLALVAIASIARIEAGTDETRNAAQPEGQEPDGEADAPENKSVDPYALGGGK